MAKKLPPRHASGNGRFKKDPTKAGKVKKSTKPAWLKRKTT